MMLADQGARVIKLERVGAGDDSWQKVWDHSVFSKNRERFLRSDLAAAFFGRIPAQMTQAGLLSDEYFTVGCDKAYETQEFV